MNKLAEDLNRTLENTSAAALLSDYGKRLYVPKGIIVQSAEAKQKAKKYNATIGIATEGGKPMYIKPIRDAFSAELTDSEIFPYAPMGGVAALRAAWLEQMKLKNPLLAAKETSLPVVTSGLTSSISIVASLFLDKGDDVVMPDLYWENYNLILTEQRQAKINFYPFFSDKGGFNVEGLKAVLQGIKAPKAFVFLNFPNNPTGYAPTAAEADEIAAVLVEQAAKGKKIVVLCDDAYFGLFFDDKVFRQSMFARLADAHENILAVKGDAATKEEMVWGFRVGFITYGCKGYTAAQYDALVQKTMGALRGSLSSCSLPSQNAILKAFASPEYEQSKQQGIEKIRLRFEALKQELARHASDDCLTPLPFNSGYFMAFGCRCDAEQLRQLLLNKYETGVIRLDDSHIRLAFSSIDLEKIPALVNTVYQAAAELS